MYKRQDLVDAGLRAQADSRIAFYRMTDNAVSAFEALPQAVRDSGALNHARFEWRVRKGRIADAKNLLLDASKSVETLGNPAAWGNRRRALARGEMRSGDPQRAYLMASRHGLTEGSDFADLEWLSGYIALRFLRDPVQALVHFRNHDDAVESPISQGRAGYWQGRAFADHHGDMGLVHINRGLPQQGEIIGQQLFSEMGPEAFGKVLVARCCLLYTSPSPRD